MTEPVHYVTNQQGEKVGVLLDLETYQHLTNLQERDPELLTNLDIAELQALAESVLAPQKQNQLDNLLVRHSDSQLFANEIATLDYLLAQVDRLNILKTRARYTLRHLEVGSSAV